MIDTVPAAARPLIAQTVRRAADVIVEHGLAKCALYDHASGAVCARGAVLTALGAQPRRTGMGSSLVARDAVWDGEEFITAALARYLFGARGPDADAVPAWSDAEETTAEDVIGALREFAAALEADTAATRAATRAHPERELVPA